MLINGFNWNFFALYLILWWKYKLKIDFYLFISMIKQVQGCQYKNWFQDLFLCYFNCFWKKNILTLTQLCFLFVALKIIFSSQVQLDALWMLNKQFSRIHIDFCSIQHKKKSFSRKKFESHASYNHEQKKKIVEISWIREWLLLYVFMAIHYHTCTHTHCLVLTNWKISLNRNGERLNVVCVYSIHCVCFSYVM